MDNTSRMNILEPSYDLIKEEPKMLLGQILVAPQYFMQVSIHELKDDIHIFEILS